MRISLKVSCLFFCLLLSAPSAYAIVTLNTSFSWDLWQDLNGDGTRSVDEVLDLTSHEATWQANGSYANNLGTTTYLNPADPSAGYSSNGNVPINSLTEPFSLSGGPGSAQSTLSGEQSGAGLNMSATATMPNGTVGARYDNISITTHAAVRFESSMFNNGTDSLWTVDDAPIHFTLGIEYSMTDPGSESWAENIELQGGQIEINRMAYGYEIVNGTNTFRSVEPPGTWTFHLETTGNETGTPLNQIVLADFELNPAQAGEIWNNFGWLFEFETRAWASYYQPVSVTPPPSDPVPEPSTFLLLGSGLAGLACYGRKRKKA